MLNEAIPIEHLIDRVSGYVHAHTLYSAVRPFGFNLMFGSSGPEGPRLYMIDPSGVYWGYFGCAIGKGKQAAKTEIEKLKLQELTCREAINEAAKIIYKVHDEVKDKAFELELSWVGEVSKGFHQLVPEDVFAAAEQFAKDAVKETDSEEEDL
ncbi:PREDICTED: proteasome subunit alpha type-3-like [Amphimedon queenslandica]|nr:PREDICTED: proteasome subunit alpha type-3-like [Amphimedon queenslandica]|eukprot:XP_003391602.2 PREDICTED: proteasome subunit alpha type-3-like [Amphimedon queenslandica]